MSFPVTLEFQVKPYEESIDGYRVIGEVTRGNEILYTKEVIASDSVESVRQAGDDVALDIELWAVKNTDFMPTA